MFISNEITRAPPQKEDIMNETLHFGNEGNGFESHSWHGNSKRSESALSNTSRIH